MQKLIPWGAEGRLHPLETPTYNKHMAAVDAPNPLLRFHRGARFTSLWSVP